VLADEAVLQIRADRSEHGPYGLFGGRPAARSLNVLNPDNASEALPAKVTRMVTRDTVVRHEQPGGGGYGDPLERDLELIRRDLHDGKTSPQFAATHYGVVFADARSEIDVEQTRARRRRLAQGAGR
jgi:N-methylhydantoinase B